MSVFLMNINLQMKIRMNEKRHSPSIKTLEDKTKNY